MNYNAKAFELDRAMQCVEVHPVYHAAARMMESLKPTVSAASLIILLSEARQIYGLNQNQQMQALSIVGRYTDYKPQFERALESLVKHGWL
jgi:hypothetical protein